MTNVKSNIVQLRAAIDRRETGDKVAAMDPTTAPPGTDEEAAAMPPSGLAIETASRAEIARPNADPDPQRSVVNAIVVAVCIAIAGIALVALLAASQS